MSRNEVNLAFESLEPKILLAGNVTVEETGAGLKITGDVESNDITSSALTLIPSGSGLRRDNRQWGAVAQFEIGGGNVKLDFKQGGHDAVEFYSSGGADLSSAK